jgi:glyceraldehyde-3-phosphate dehydrogenase (NADP+)
MDQPAPLAGGAPATGGHTVPMAGTDNWRRADPLAVAEAHLDPLPLGERASLLRRWADRLERRSEDLARTICRSVRKPISLARAEVARGLTTLRATADACRLLVPAGVALDGAGSAEIHRAPVGPVLAVTPFNFPLNLALHKLAPAIAAGCPALWKPSPKAPGVAELAMELLHEAGAEAGLVQLVHADDAQVEAWCRDRRLGLLSFTGSAAVGWRLHAACTRARTVLELGGNAAVVLDRVADVPAVAARIAWGAGAHAGQVCIKVQRIFIPHGREDLVAALAAAFAGLPHGDPWDPATVCGPAVDDAAAARAAALVEELRGLGGRVLAGGVAGPWGLAPTLVDGLTAHAEPVRDREWFAPVASLHRYRDLDDAFDQVELAPFGINAGLYSDDPAAAARAFQRLRVGTLVVGDIPTRRDDRLPYGGMKASGHGREGTLDAVLAYSEPKVLWRPAGS